MSVPLDAAIAQVVRAAGQRAGTGASEQARVAQAWRRHWAEIGADVGGGCRAETVAAGVSPAKDTLEAALGEGADRCASACAQGLDAIGVRVDSATCEALAQAARASTQRWMATVASEGAWLRTLDAIARVSAGRPVGGLSLERVGALAQVPPSAWTEIGGWPWWARALALHGASPDALRQGRAEALASVLARRSDGACATRALASLETWPFEWALPPLEVVALTAREGVAPIEDEGAWGGAVRLEREARTGGTVGGQRFGEDTDTRAQRVRDTIGKEGARMREAMANASARWRASNEIDDEERKRIERAWARGQAGPTLARYAPALVENEDIEEGVAWQIDHDRVGHIETVCALRGRSPAQIAGGSAATWVRLIPVSIRAAGPVLEEVGHTEHERYDPQRGERARAAFGR